MNSKMAAALVAISLAVFLYTASFYKPTGSIIKQETLAPDARDTVNMPANRTNTGPSAAPENKSGLNATAITPGLQPPAEPVRSSSNASGKCSAINCPKSVIVCPDGTRSSCRNFCLPDSGACTDCKPECIDSGPKATTAADDKSQPPCTENWQCSPWGECKDGNRKRECSDANSCGTSNAKPLLMEQCQQKEQPASIRIISIQADAPGDDRKKESWNGEWVLIEGFASDMTGYTLSDSSSHAFAFPDGFALAGRAKIYSGDGNNTKDELYWNGGRRPIWNNDGDKATIKDREGKVVAEYEY